MAGALLKGSSNMAQSIPRSALIDWSKFAEARHRLGPQFAQQLRYFHEDGDKSLVRIEDALRAHDAGAMVSPADLIKTEAVHVAAFGLAQMAENVEFEARDCVDLNLPPDTLLEMVVSLREAFVEVDQALDREVNPLMQRWAPSEA
jgi:hypothetical protein